MGQQNEDLVREAYQAYGRGDVDQMLSVVDPALEWTFLDPSEEDPEPRTCHGREQLAHALRRQAAQGLRSQVEEVTGHGDQVLVVIRTPGVDRTRARQAGDRNYLVLTVQQGRITRMRACRDAGEARGFAGLV